MRGAENRDPRKECGRSQQIREGGTRRFGKVCPLASLRLLPVSVPNNLRVTCEIEWTLREGEDTPHIKRNKSKDYKLEIQAILVTLKAQSSNAGERAPGLAPVSPPGTVTTSVFGSGTSSTLPSPTLYGMLIAPRLFPPPQLQHCSLWTFDQTRVRSA